MADGIDPSFQQQLDRLFAHAPKTIAIQSGFRSSEEQAALHAKAEQQHPGEASKWAAAPGTSWHEKGLAADLRFADPATLQGAHDHAAEYGLVFPMSWEPWHIQPLWTQGRKSTDVATPDGAVAGTTQPPDGHPPDTQDQTDPLGRIFGTVTSMVKSSADLGQHPFHDDSLTIGQRWNNIINPVTPQATGGLGTGLAAQAGAAGTPNTSTPGGANYQRAYQWVIEAGGTPQEAAMLAAFAGPESSYQVGAVSKPNRDGTIDRGLFQINSVHSQYDQDQLTTDPVYNAKAALDILRTQGPTAWSVYNNGDYKQYVPGGSKAS